MIQEVNRTLRRLRNGKPVQSGPISVIHTRIEQRQVSFCVDMENDPIQRNHAKGRFYEAKELNDLAAHFPKGGIFVDIGANVGNHSLFAALFLGASKVVPIEPNPLAFRLLIQNVLVNGLLDRFDLSKLGVGVSDTHNNGYAMEVRERNLGGAKMLPGEGDIEVYPADVLLAGLVPSLIKIDVEGMEISVLNGLSGILATSKPVLLVEVDTQNDAEFSNWVAQNDYRIEKSYQRYKTNKNYLLVAL